MEVTEIERISVASSISRVSQFTLPYLPNLPVMPEDARLQIEKRVEAIEAGYEFMLAFAAQGLPHESGSASGSQIREFLKRFDDALTGLTDAYTQVVEGEGYASPDKFGAFMEVLDRDAKATQAAIRLVLAQSTISSQLVDNLNASIHVRALLTDVFLIDEAVKKTPTST